MAFPTATTFIAADKLKRDDGDKLFGRGEGLRTSVRRAAKNAMADYGKPAKTELEIDQLAGKAEASAGRQVSSIQSELNRGSLGSGRREGADTKALLGLGGAASQSGAASRMQANILNEQLSAQKDKDALAQARGVIDRRRADVKFALQIAPKLAGAEGEALDKISEGMKGASMESATSALIGVI
jgi:hypothetical protein